MRLAFAEVMHEPLPERLIAAARGETLRAKRPASERARSVAARRSSRPGATAQRAGTAQRWRIGLPVAASLFGLLLGGSVAYVGVSKLAPAGLGGKQPAVETAAVDKAWLDNAAGYFKLFVSAGDNGLIDVPASGDPREALQKISQSLPQEVRLPDLKPWGLNFRGARLVVAEGRPAAQLVYTTDNKAIGPLILIIGSSKEADISPTLPAARMSTCCTGGTRAALTRSPARPTSAISGASPTTSPGSSTPSDPQFAQVKKDRLGGRMG